LPDSTLAKGLALEGAARLAASAAVAPNLGLLSASEDVAEEEEVAVEDVAVDALAVDALAEELVEGLAPSCLGLLLGLLLGGVPGPLLPRTPSSTPEVAFETTLRERVLEGVRGPWEERRRGVPRRWGEEQEARGLVRELCGGEGGDRKEGVQWVSGGVNWRGGRRASLGGSPWPQAKQPFAQTARQTTHLLLLPGLFTQILPNGLFPSPLKVGVPGVLLGLSLRAPHSSFSSLHPLCRGSLLVVTVKFGLSSEGAGRWGEFRKVDIERG
jgi:hypothetical protein